MSYLGFPRLHFSGKFQADPSTINNNPTNFDTTNFVPRDRQFGAKGTYGSWNPKGSGSWRMVNCQVQSVYYRDGTYCNDPWLDPVIGSFLQDASDRVSAKLVDLDPEQQNVSEIWGMQIRLVDKDQNNVFKSEFEVIGLSDLWVTRSVAGGGSGRASADYQSILTDIQWSNPPLASRFVEELRKNGRRSTTLSIKFMVDGFDLDPNSPTFGLGRIVGAIGLYDAENEPKHFVNGRLLRTQKPPDPPPGQPPNVQVFSAPCRIDSEKQMLLVDFSNSLPTTVPGGPLLDLGPLKMAIMPEGAEPVVIGDVDYHSPGFYDINAGIQGFPLSNEQLALAKTAPLALVSVNGNPSHYTIYLSENSEGLFARADQFVFRFDSGIRKSQMVTLYATKFGYAQPGIEFQLVFDQSSQASIEAQRQAPGPLGATMEGPPTGTPPKGLILPSPKVTDEKGRVNLKLSAGSPGNPRQYIDGQVYGVAYRASSGDEYAPPDYQKTSCNIISCLVWEQYKVKGADGIPTWLDDIQPIFEQYANLYPVMKDIVDLSDYESVISRVDTLQLAFSLEPKNPNYMPVTRDLSPSRRSIISSWLNQHPQPLYRSKIRDVTELKEALQTAIELEHSTIPTYLTALFSIKQGQNTEVAEIIRSVVMEEMLHMSLACNLLNAIGGHPAINTPSFVPEYPTRLPGGLRPDLVVSLKKCSREHIRNVFMSIEAPDEKIDVNSHLTIGWFYDLIREAFETLGDDIFVGNRALQLEEWPHGEMIVVYDVDSAKRAIDEIVEQGEGHSRKDPFDEQGNLGHYYRFAEIVEGRRLVKDPDTISYSFTGEPIAFDESGVWPIIDNPDTQKLEPGSQARFVSEEFDQAYCNLLNALHITFNGQPGNIQTAIGLMFSLKVLADRIVRTPTGFKSEVYTGPSFQYPGVKTS